MRGSKVKMLRRFCWTDKPNGRSRTMKELKQEYCKGVTLGLCCYYPRQGRNWKELLND